MSDRPASPHPPSPSTPVGLEGFQQPPSDEGISLDQLSAAFAEMLSTGADPYAASTQAPAEPPADSPQRAFEAAVARLNAPPEELEADVTPQGILEAMLFVGNPQNLPLSAQRVAELMRGVRPAEVDQWIGELNEQYAAHGCPYMITSTAGGYRLELTGRYQHLAERFYRRERHARLSQAAVETLAAVAYHEPVTREQVDELRGRASSHLLSQLVRRRLLRVERSGTPRTTRYLTTPRFLELFGLESLADLPRSQDLETR